MKAESIEQIREHLARGGEAIGHVETACICGRVEQVFPDDDILVVCPAGEWKGAHSVWRFDQASYWELLPIEEELTDEEVDAEIARLGIDMKPAFERLHKMIQAKRGVPIEEEKPKPSREWLERMAAEEDKCVSVAAGCFDESCVTCGIGYYLPSGRCDHCNTQRELPGIDVKTLPLLKEDPTGESRRWKPSTFPDIENAIPVELHQRIRQSLLFGHYPAMNDLRDWWQATTGERIEWGRRCNYCGCTGEDPISSRSCPKCNASGYTVRPTWMEERV